MKKLPSLVLSNTLWKIKYVFRFVFLDFSSNVVVFHSVRDMFICFERWFTARKSERDFSQILSQFVAVSRHVSRRSTVSRDKVTIKFVSFHAGANSATNYQPNAVSSWTRSKYTFVVTWIVITAWSFVHRNSHLRQERLLCARRV